jgi:hypothetical protein
MHHRVRVEQGGLVMTAVTVAGLVAGNLLIFVAASVFYAKKAFPAGGVGVAAIGLVLVGMSHWTYVKIAAGGVTIETMRNDIRRTADAADAVAAEAQQAGESLKQVRQQVVNLTRLLDSSHVVSPAATQPIRDTLNRAPTVNIERLESARVTLKQIRVP